MNTKFDFTTNKKSKTIEYECLTCKSKGTTMDIYKVYCDHCGNIIKIRE